MVGSYSYSGFVFQAVVGQYTTMAKSGTTICRSCTFIVSDVEINGSIAESKNAYSGIFHL
jgi:hypothetical protein